MSQRTIGEFGATLPETTVRGRSRQSNRLHRQDPEADEPRPACPEGDMDGAEFTSVPTVAYRPHYQPCRNPECFGRGWR